MGVVDLEFAAAVLAWLAVEADDVPSVLNLIDPHPPSRAQLLQRLRNDNPEIKVIWIPRGAIVPALNAVGILARLRSSILDTTLIGNVTQSIRVKAVRSSARPALL
jgi:hypothetical protein